MIAEEMNPKEIVEYIDSKLIGNVVPLDTERDAICLIEEFAAEQKRIIAIEFEGWINDEGWIRDPFPRTEFEDDILRYTNIATIDHHSDDKLKMYTPSELYDKFLKERK